MTLSDWPFIVCAIMILALIGTAIDVIKEQRKTDRSWREKDNDTDR